MDKKERLRRIMADHSLTIEEVATLLKRSPQTVRTWRCKNNQDIPDTALELLELKTERSAA